jgi:hypothetical protein
VKLKVVPESLALAKIRSRLFSFQPAANNVRHRDGEGKPMCNRGTARGQPINTA